jgi:uncharacterized protein YbcI
MNKDSPASAHAAERTLAAVPAAASIQLEIGNAIVRVNKELFGRGPTRARVIIQGNAVVCVLGDCLTTAERTLVQNGRREPVTQLRNEMSEIARPKLTRMVEGITRRRVVACVTGIDLDADEYVATFMLGGPWSPDTDERDPAR